MDTLPLLFAAATLARGIGTGLEGVMGTDDERNIALG